MQTIGSTRIDETSKMKSHQAKLKFLIDNKSDIITVGFGSIEEVGESIDLINKYEQA